MIVQKVSENDKLIHGPEDMVGERGRWLIREYGKLLPWIQNI